MPEPARSPDTGGQESRSDQSSQLIVDCHLDLAWNALGYKRDLTLPLAELNRGEHGLADHAGRGLATTTLPEMRTGGVGLCLATLIARTPVAATAIHGNCNFRFSQHIRGNWYDPRSLAVSPDRQ